ncbi:bromodomain-containing protein DDB_G0280777 isoform X10 [Drosophila obscura]|uniref:bromodomain-containing protein DDB_G0280777 isoform X10 n=1 Tax=Drosophila obscura TaxID=7282 RepID=UPI001BB26D05|nr:bromodomain-containing protein DDB_G0280777 isoform X10 [Drosophila obscura]
MAALQRKLVHKQFNSPMGLYSQDNVKATLNRELKAFGGEGIEIDDQISKPLNLANSAVLRAVEEEEQQAKCGYKRVAWPPASEERIIREFTPQPQTQSPAPGAGGYYPQPAAAAAAPQPSAAPAQGPIYNNVQPRSTPTPQPQAPQQQQFQYGATPVQEAAPAPAPSQYPDQSYPYEQQQQQQQQQQPVQYTQAQFNRQASREPVATDAYPNYQSNYQQEPLTALDNAGGGWKPIRAPLPKSQHDYTPAGGAAAPYQQQRPAYLQQQPQYGNQHQQQQPAAPQWQQQQAAPQQAAPQQPAPQWQQQQAAPQQPAPLWQQQQAAPQQPAPQWQQQQAAPQQPAPQWQQQQYQAQPLAQGQAPYQTSPYQQAAPQPQPQQQQQQQQPSYYPQQNGGTTYAQPQYNSYSQPQQQQLPYSQDQTDLQQQQHQVPVAYAGQDAGYRGASPGIITLRKEAPVSQQSAPVYTSQPAAVSYQGGSKLRGDLKWPPPEYKEAAARENEERRQLALGPVCRPRKVNRDYTSFFAKNQLNNGYPSYKVPPGTQHMFA